MLDFVGSCAADHRQNQPFRRAQNKALEAKVSIQNRNLRFKNNHSALIFGSFHQGKEQRFTYFNSILSKILQ
jgi:hypothetical protein